VKVYRYRAAEGEDCREGTVFDGRYRYLLYDTDYGMGLKFLGWFGLEAESPRLDELCKRSEHTGMFRSLLRREEFRILFINCVMHLMNGAFSPEVVSNVLNEYNGKRDRELVYMMESTELLKNSLWEPDDNNIENVTLELAEIVNFAEIRSGFVQAEMQQMWNCGELMQVSVASIPGGSLYIGGVCVREKEYEGSYPGNVPLEIWWDTDPGITVQGYYVNSGFVKGERLSVMPGEWQEEGYVLIEPVYETEPVESLVIDSYHIRGPEDYVVLCNNGQTTVSLSEYALTDSEEKWTKGRLPDVKVEPGEEYIVYGGEYSGSRVENSVQFSFSWKKEEKIWLIHASGRVVDCRN